MDMNDKNGPYVYTGEVVNVGERLEFGTNGFAKREFLVSPDPTAEYPSFLQFTLKNGKKEDKTQLVTKTDFGRKVRVTFYVDTRKWTSKTTGKDGYTTEASVVKVEWLGSMDTPTPSNAKDGAEDLAMDDMPF